MTSPTSAVHAAEVGDVRVASHTGQPLVADIELTMLEDAATPVGVRIADREVYSGAGIAVPPVLSSLNLTVMRRDGRQFLHVTSLRPVDADHLHLYVELSDKGQRAVRLATLWLTPDPNPVSVAAPVLAAAPAPLPAVPAAPAVAVRTPTPPRAHVEPAVPVLAPAPAPADKVRAKAVETDAKPAHPAPAARPLPLSLPLPPAGANPYPQACARPSADVQACAALGAKSAELRAQLGRLEDKVKVLQAKLGITPGAHGAAPVPPAGADKPAPAHAEPAAAAGPAPAKPEAAHADAAHAAQPTEAPAPAAQHDGDAAKAAPPEAARPPVPAKPKPIHSIKTLVPQKPKTPATDDSLPWRWIGAAAGVLALAGAAGALVAVRRRRSRNVDIPAAPGLLDKLKRRFAARTQPAAAAPQADAPPAEPTLE